MPDNTGKMQTTFIVNTSQIDQAIKRIEDLKKARDDAKKSKDKSSMFEGELRSLDELSGKLKETQKELRDLQKVNNGNSYISYAKQISEAKARAEELYQVMKKTNNESTQKAFADAKKELVTIVQKSDEFNRSLGIQADKIGVLGSFAQKFRSHFNWILAGAALSGLAAVPTLFLRNMAEIEKGMAGMEQVIAKPQTAIENLQRSLEAIGDDQLLRTFKDPAQVSIAKEQMQSSMELVSPDAINTHEQLNRLTQEFIDIASKYGETVKDVTESGKLWGRAYKDLAVVQTMIHASSKLAVADSFDMVTANKALESSIMQWGFEVKNNNDAMVVSNRIIDSWTNLAHNYTVSAQTLATANQRMASSAKQVGVSFDFAQSLVAVIARKVTAEGGEIGNALRSIFASIHTKKAVEELDALGVAVKTTGADGTEQFRNVEEVLVDVMLKTQDTTQNVESLFKALAGGKWQWNKLGAMVDYQEFIQALNLSINSQGTTDTQVQMQLDTISRKVQTLNVELQRLSTGNGALTSFIKSIIDGTTMLIRLMDRFPASAINLQLIVIAVVALKYAWDRLSASWTVATKAYSDLIAKQMEGVAAANASVAAQSRLGAAITMLGGRFNLITFAITAAISAYGIYESMTNKVGNSMDEISKKNDNLNESYQMQQAQLDAISKNAPYITLLGNAYRTLTERQNSNTESVEKAKKTNDELYNTKKTLIAMIGEQGFEEMKAAGFTEEAIDRQKTSYIKGKESIEDSMAEIRKEIFNTTMEVSNRCKEQITAITNEAISFDKAADAIGEALGKIQKYLYIYYKEKSNFLGKQKENIQKEATDGSLQKAWKMAGIPTDNVDKVVEETVRGFSEQQQIVEDKAAKIANDAKKIYVNQSLQALQEWNKVSGNSNTTGDLGGGGAVRNTDKDKKGTDPMPPSDHSAKLTKDAYKDAQTKMFHEAKMSADRYKESLDNLVTSEDLYGKTVESTNERFVLVTSRIQQLSTEEAKYSNEAEYLNNILDERITASQELLGIVGYTQEQWKALSGKEKTRIKLENKEYLEQHELTRSIAITMYKYSEHASAARVSINGLTNDMKKMKLGDTGDFIKQINRNIEGIKNQEAIDLAVYSNKFDLNNDAKLNEIKLKSMLKQQEQYYALIRKYGDDLRNYQSQENNNMVQQTEDALRRVLLAYEQNAAAIRDLEYAKDTKIREGLYGITQDVLIQGNTLKNVWKKLWTDLANDALRQLFRVQSGSGGILGMLFGLGPSKSSAVSTASSMSSVPTIGGAPIERGGHADGGIFDTEHIASFAEGDKAEAVIPLETNRGRALSIFAETAKRLGIPKGTSVSTEVSQRTINTAKSMAETKANTAHLAKLDEQIGLLTQQNNMMLHIINNGGIGGGVVAQPIIVQQGQSNDALATQIAEMKRRGYSV